MDSSGCSSVKSPRARFGPLEGKAEVPMESAGFQTKPLAVVKALPLLLGLQFEAIP